MAPGDKLLLWMEQRSYLFRGVDYVHYHIGSGAPTLELVHRFGDHRALGCELRAMGITHVMINRRFEKTGSARVYWARNTTSTTSLPIGVASIDWYRRTARLLYSDAEFRSPRTRRAKPVAPSPPTNLVAAHRVAATPFRLGEASLGANASRVQGFAVHESTDVAPRWRIVARCVRCDCLGGLPQGVGIFARARRAGSFRRR